MATLNETSSVGRYVHNNEFYLLEILLVIARHTRMVLSVTILFALISTIIVMRSPTIYTSSAKLLVLEYSGQTESTHFGNDSKIVLGKKRGQWRPADVTIIKNILESTKLNQIITNRFRKDQPGKLEFNQSVIQIKQERAPGVISIKVNGRDKNTSVHSVAYYQLLEFLENLVNK